MSKTSAMTDKNFHLRVAASDRLFYNGPCSMAVLPAIDGELGVLADHEPMVTAVAAGELRYLVDGEWVIAAVGDGFAEITPEKLVLVVDTAESPEEIDIRRADEARQRAEERLRHRQAILEYYHTKAALARAMARLKVTKKL
ncbi:ATP synthase F1 subunit epsilon [Bacilliculturomica massiliensis]|uniref:ATP synthase F1 subunit epsilon n=1 Tax=Bacilliculturomica massiliensis TaxID=1917867 RepID=UPI002ED21671